jgi:LPS sulfotransferase NodH
MAEFCIICAAARSGTTFLGDAVRTAYDAAWPEEIFHDGFARPGLDYRNAPEWQVRSSFFNFCAAAFARRPELSYPDANSRRALLDLYLENLRSVFPEDRYLIDIKYGSWSHFDGFRRRPGEPPYLLELAREKGIPIVHLVRENSFALYCSLRLAILSGIWSLDPGETAGMRTLKVDLEDCRYWMTEASKTQQRFAKWLRGHAVYNLTYESLVENGRFRQGVSDVFTEIFGRPPIRELTTTYTKILPPLSRVVENAEEVLDYFAGTEFEAFVKMSLLEP